ncbi:MAG: hypothetical protein K6U74_12250 [Firmicutes bacterium]|nr:hypothetical protein [Bacillota bacterium]
MKEWHVEDAGGGCRAFSEVLVLVCENTGEVFFDLMPLTWSDGTSMEEKACQLLSSMMERAGVTREDRLLVCSGNIFHAYHNWLTEQGYNWEPSKIDGLAHNVAEEHFHRQASAAGFPEEIRLVERNYRDYYRVIEEWVKEDSLRAVHLKDMEVRRKPSETRYILKSNGGHTRSCMQCRKKIPAFTPVVVYRCRENGRKVRRYFHPDCSPVAPFKSTLETFIIKWGTFKIEGVILTSNQEKRICAVCQQPILPGDRAFYGYAGDKIIAGHLCCFEKENCTGHGA